MKKLFFYLLIITASFSTSHAQLNVNINLGSQPLWGPAGYNYVDYYYLPDIETYYYVPKRQFIYLNNGHWVFANTLPARYQGYNLYNGYKVVINRPTPYLQFNEDRVKYVGFKNKKGSQITIKQKQAKKLHPVKASNSGAPNNGAKGNGGGKWKSKGENGNGGRGNGKDHGKGKH